MKLTRKQADFVRLAHNVLGRELITKKDIIMLKEQHSSGRQVWFTHDPKYKAGRGQWKLPLAELAAFDASHTGDDEEETNVVEMPTATGPYRAPAPIETDEVDLADEFTAIGQASAVGLSGVLPGQHIPQKLDTFVPYGIYGDIKRVIDSRAFFPVYITGHKGLGKTIQIEQACAELGRDCFRVPITIETDEDDLLGGFRLVDGQTVYHLGPVPIAMLVGGILNLDEIDKASNKIMCLQPVLEGRGIFLKKINKFIKPAPGFNVFSTANTKGKGSEDSRYITSQVLDDSFLGRYAIMFEQEQPSSAVEKKILEKNLELLNLGENPLHEDFVDKLVQWSDVVKRTHADGGVDEIVDTRGLVYMLKSYAIFAGDRMKAMRGYCNKFDETTKLAFMRAYEALDANANVPADPKQPATVNPGALKPFFS
jgi:hypothetical protein